MYILSTNRKVALKVTQWSRMIESLTDLKYDQMHKQNKFKCDTTTRRVKTV